MSWIQRVVLRLSGSRAVEIERESRAWVATCTHCGNRQSYWDLGGIRYRASSTGKRVRLNCPACRQTGMAEVTRQPEAPST